MPCRRGSPYRFLDQAVVVRSGQAVADRTQPGCHVAAALENRCRSIRLSRKARPRIAPSPGRRICLSGSYRLHLTDAVRLHRGGAVDRGAATGIRRRFRPLLAAGGPALRRPLGAQLGHRGFHRPRRLDRAGRRPWAPTASGSIRCTPCSTTARAIAAPIRRTAGCFSIRSISTSKNCRDFSARSPSKGAIARLRRATLVDYAAVAELKWRALRFGIRRPSRPIPKRERQAGFREVSRRARAAAVAVRLLRGAAAQIQQAVVGMAGRMAAAGRGQMRRACARARMPPRSNSSNSCNGPPTGNCRPASELAGRLGMKVGLYLDVAVGVQSDGFDAWNEQTAISRHLVGRRAAGPAQHRRPELGPCRLQRRRSRTAIVRAVSRDAAGLDAPCRRDPARSCARPEAALSGAARFCRRQRRLCADAVRGAAGGDRAGKRRRIAAW